MWDRRKCLSWPPYQIVLGCLRSPSSEADSRSTAPSGPSFELSWASQPSSASISFLLAVNPTKCNTSSEYGTATKHAAAVASTKAKAPVLAGNGRDSDDTTASWISTSPILERLRGKIKRGEYIHLSLLLQGNLAAACESRSESTSECARLLSESASLPIMYFTG